MEAAGLAPAASAPLRPGLIRDLYGCRLRHPCTPVAPAVTSPSSAAEDLSSAVAAAFARRRSRSAAGAWIVDGFAGAALQRAALRGAAADPGALARAAAGGRGVLVEEDPGLVARLEAALGARRVGDPAACEAGEVVLVEAGLAAVAGALTAAIGDAPALLHLAPLSARALPSAVLVAIASIPGADLLLRVPAEDFARVGRFGGPLADLPPHLRRVVQGCSDLLADPRHGWIAAWREAARGSGEDAAAAVVADRLRQHIEDAADGLSTRVVDIEGVPLLLATRDPARFLELNGALRDAGMPPRPTLPPIAISAEPAAEPAPDAPLDLFPLAPPPPEPESDAHAPDLRAVADLLHARHRGTLASLAELAASLAESGLSSEDLHGALRLLKRSGRAAYRTLDAEGAEIDFLVDPAPSATRPRRPRRAAPPEPDLFDPPDP